MGGFYLRLASAAVMLGRDVPGMAPLLDELLDHPERHFEPPGDLFTAYVPEIVGFENPFT
jgi:hypothetical protein